MHTKQGSPVPRAQPGNMDTYKVWFDTTTLLWCVTKANDRGGMLTVRNLQFCEVDIQTSGRVMVVTAELIADGRTLRLQSGTQNAHAEKAVLRLARIFDQVVNVPVALARSRVN